MRWQTSASFKLLDDSVPSEIWHVLSASCNDALVRKAFLYSSVEGIHPCSREFEAMNGRALSSWLESSCNKVHLKNLKKKKSNSASEMIIQEEERIPQLGNDWVYWKPHLVSFHYAAHNELLLWWEKIQTFHLWCVLRIRIFMTILSCCDGFGIRTYDPKTCSSMKFIKIHLHVP